MIELLVFLSPACISMLIHNWMMNKEYNSKEYFTIYGGYVFIINFISFLILFLTKEDYFSLSENFNKASFIFKMLIIDFASAIIFPFIICIINKNCTLEAGFERDKNENSKKRR